MKLKNIFVGLFLIAGISTASAAVSITKEAGWLESVYAQWTPLSEYTNYHAYIRPQGGTYTQLDQYLLRNYGTYCRVDAVGLKAGKYQLKIVPVDASGNEVAAQAKETAVLTATAYDRNGYAHFNEKYNGIGAYKNDGTLKSGAKVFYVTANTAKKITTNVITDNKGKTTTCTGMQAIIDAYQKGQDTTPLCFRIIGTVTTSDMDKLSSSAEGLQIKGKGADSELNITIEGIGNDAFINGFGFLLRNAASVEIRNIGVRTLMDDGISLDTDNDHIWLHHIDVFYGKSSGGDHAKGDGAIDVKSDSKHVTIAYCHFWDTGKSTMCGMTSESGENWITYHHNWFDHSDSRHPRIRTMSVHIYNNYFDGNAKYGVGSTTHSDVFVENNYFRNCAKPILISKQGTDIHNGVGTSDETKGTFSGEAGGMVKSYGNIMEGTYTYRTYQQDTKHFDAYEATSRNEQVPSTVVALLGGATYNNFDTDASKIYSYTPDAAKDVPTIIKGEYGAGRCEHGDFQFTFTDADDTDYDVNSKLKAALDSYKSSLISIVGNSDTISPNPDPTPGGDEDGDGDGDDDDDDPTPTPGGEYECHFTNKTPSSSFYTVSGNYSDSKGTFTAPNGTTYKVCLKMESSTSVKFTTTTAFTLYLGFDKEAPNIKIDDTKVSGSNKVITYELAAGSHELTKADSHNLYYINLISKGDDGDGDGDDDGGDGDDDGGDEDTAIDETTTTTLFFDGQQVLNPEGEEVRIYTVTGNAVLVSNETTIDATVLPQGMYIGVGESTSIRFFIH